MSSKNAKQRETLRGQVPPERGEDGTEDLIEWRPDWGRNCDVCGQTPCMVGVSCGVVMIEATRCADCLDDDSAAARVAIGY
ncbi:hypothetical protein [Paraburkholderia strydomiana]|uniref:hypothetical protein n=1 Tax=Paraburkholderia strydomiana TaxID=1245417 RepID=UPI001BE94F96|nr:hypothetical protein [Paraburkholderia strydomiana]MBT2789181.1 hypothetical protein [Paraburkholderia strydomiana]